MKILLFLLTTLFSLSLNSVEVKNDERIILEKFWKTTFYESEFGYVYFGLKPVCQIGYWKKDALPPGIIRHKNNVIFKEGMAVWKECGFSTMTPFNLCACENAYDENMVDIIFINRELAKKTIDENITLFQYCLGPGVTSEKLVEEIENPHNKFLDVLGKNNVLIGIVLGYGAKNSIAVSRSEKIVKEFFNFETPPVKPLYNRLQSEILTDDTGFFESGIKRLSAFEKTPPSSEKILTPSFGWDKISKEFSHLSKQTTASSVKLAKEKPNLFFGRLKNCPESEKYVRKLEKAQSKIQKLLINPFFSSEVMKTITGESNFSPQSNSHRFQSLSLSPAEMRYLPKIIADSIFFIHRNESDKFFEGLIKGMEDADKNTHIAESDRQALTRAFYDKEKCENLIEAKANFELCRKIFENLRNDSSQIEIIPGKLYYKTTKQGFGQTLENDNQVLVYYTLTMGPKEELICDNRASGIPKKINLAECIKGFSKGLDGIKEGEEREIMIHPSLGYGLYTTLERAQYIKAKVNLLKIYPVNSYQKNSELSFIPIETEFPDDLEHLCEENQWKAGYLRGFQVWRHYKRCNDYTLDEVCKNLQAILTGKEFKFPCSIDPNRVINRLHWNIYSQEDYQLTY
jgi:FKBP-type peptidyl-prolyl cis-trans isomerase